MHPGKVPAARVANAPKGGFIDNDTILRVAPAIFAKEASPTTLGKYAFVSTAEVLETMFAMDYVPTMVAQQRAQYRHEDMYQKHMIRMRHRRFLDESPKVGDTVPELIIVNSHNASCKFHGMAGLWRFICANGLMVGDTVSQYSFAHTRGVWEQIHEAVEHFGTTLIPRLTDEVQRMRARQLTEQERTVFAARAIGLRWPEGTEAVTTGDLLSPRRQADAANDAWTVYNRVQENVIQGGFRAANRNRAVQRLENVTSVVNVNRALWDMAARLAA